MKNIRTIVLSLLALTLLQACREDSLSGAGGENRECEVKISGTIEQRSAATTRASDSGFADGDAVGLYVVDYANDEPSQLLPQGNHANNMRHTYNAASNSWKGTATITGQTTGQRWMPTPIIPSAMWWRIRRQWRSASLPGRTGKRRMPQ